MQLKLKRSQTTSGILSKAAVFCLDVRAELTAEESHNVKKYDLGKEVVYSSEAAKEHAHTVLSGNSGFLKTVTAKVLFKLALVITVDSLTRGQRIEGKNLAEIMAAEEAVMEACQNLKGYLAAAMTFDGREHVLEV